MLNQLHLYNFPTGYSIDHHIEKSHFILKTCQRTLVLSYGQKLNFNPALRMETEHGVNAYIYLLETICGLKSKLLGENEIVGQFKEAFKSYLNQPMIEKKMIRVLEKLLKDAKDIRTQHLIGISQKTYASITKKIMLRHGLSENILILGSGALAEDLINQFKKRAKIFVSARNQERLSQLAQIHQIEIVPWNDHTQFLEHAFIANTIGCKSEVILSADFFEAWNKKHKQKAFIDLGSPSTIRTNLTVENNLYRLENIFEEGAIHQTLKMEKLNQAHEAIRFAATRREQLFVIPEFMPVTVGANFV
ncbi:MAG: hypothetical protein JNM93_13590 [Bacteriovoracaceae bacterium]|nr:hypothetical protein [Bacteriovoracaceae bacterium]